MLICDLCKVEIPKNDIYVKYVFPKTFIENKVTEWYETKDVCQLCSYRIARAAGVQIQNSSSPNLLDTVGVKNEVKITQP